MTGSALGTEQSGPWSNCPTLALLERAGGHCLHGRSVSRVVQGGGRRGPVPTGESGPFQRPPSTPYPPLLPRDNTCPFPGPFTVVCLAVVMVTV